MSYVVAAYNKEIVKIVKEFLEKYRSGEMEPDEIVMALLNHPKVEKFFKNVPEPWKDLHKLAGIVGAAHRIAREHVDDVINKLNRGENKVIDGQTLVFGASLILAAYKLAKEGKLKLGKVDYEDPVGIQTTKALKRIQGELLDLKEAFAGIPGADEVIELLHQGNVNVLNLLALLGDKKAYKELMEEAEKTLDAVGNGFLSKEDAKWHINTLELPKPIKEDFLSAVDKINHTYTRPEPPEMPKPKRESRIPFNI